MYESYYGLRGKPFQLNPDPSFYFASRGHKRALAYLEYGLYQGEGFIVITGEVGAGKTTIQRNLLAQLDQARIVARQIVSTQLGPDDFLRAVGVAFGVPVRDLDKAMLLASLEAYFCKLATENQRALLVVDEAQNLSRASMEELRMLSNFQLDDRALLQSFLVGQPELRSLMQSPDMRQLRQRVIASYHLGPLSEDETQAYIEHRLRHVDWNGDPHFEPRAFEAIHTLAEGVPRRINTLCNRVMLAGYLSEMHSISAADVQSVAAEMDDEIALAQPTELSSVRDLGPATAPHVLRRRGERSAGTVMPDDIIERLDRLERTMAVALDLLRRLSHAQNRPSSDARSHEKG